ncbi:uncharacterized protein LOC111074708 [Drosophila obscura]|uniref:uncharacterized protein LOC111074708 n=1 Tax=Drosophila obscura TaxID=7282 RepID=UPI001BB28544|nr:uncharacterized protein LOC111074708 [Drosophila obscura]
MHLNKTTLLLLVLTVSAGCVLAKPEPNLLEGLLKNSTSQFAQDAANFGEQLAQALHKAFADALSDFSSNVQAALQNLRGVIRNVSDRVKRNALQEALKTLERISASAVELEASIAEITSSWKSRGKTGALRAEAEDIINELQNRYTAYLHSCLEELQARQGQYEQKVHETITQFQNATNDLLGQINICLNRTSESISCHRGINKAIDQLRDAPRALLSLKLQGLQLLGVGLDASSCVGQTVAEYALEKPSVQRQLEEIIERYREASSDKSSSSEDSSSSDESSSSDKDSSSDGSSSSDEDSSERSSTSEDDTSTEVVTTTT